MSGWQNTIWVIVRSTGEYSDRIETPIRYCMSEDEAKEAIALIAVEAQRDIDRKPPFRRESTHAWITPKGEESNRRQDGARFGPKANAAEIEAQNEIWKAEYNAAIAALGHVDPDGSWCGDGYYYAEVSLWPDPPSPTQDAGGDT